MEEGTLVPVGPDQGYVRLEQHIASTAAQAVSGPDFPRTWQMARLGCHKGTAKRLIIRPLSFSPALRVKASPENVCVEYVLINYYLLEIFFAV